MYEPADWGHPVSAPQWGQRERLNTHLSHSLIRVLRSRARAQGVSLDALIDRLLHEALAMEPQSGPRISAVD